MKALLVLGLLFLAPLAYFGELEVWTFDEPVSNLEWDEGMQPQQSGGETDGGSGGGSSSDAGSSGSSSGSGSDGGSAGSEGSAGTGDSGGSASGGSGGGSGMAFGFPGFFMTFSLCFGLMWLAFAQGMAGFFAAMAQVIAAMMWFWVLLWAILLAAIGYVLIWMGVLGGLVGIGGLATLYILYQKGIILSSA